jgi:organic hydroperoxide reductase OsmC/OhrA
VQLDVNIPGVDHDKALEVVQAAHQVCPYSNATRGNVDVALNVT